MAQMPFNNVCEGDGGTFKGGVSFEKVGTFWCKTCVGVYFPIDNTQCFVAHINGGSGCKEPLNLVSDLDGDIIQKTVYDRLVQSSIGGNGVWNIEHPKFGSKVIVVCPEPEILGLKSEARFRRTGWYFVEGIRDFLRSRAVTLDDTARTLSEPVGKQDKRRSERAQALKTQASALKAEADRFEIDTTSQGFVIWKAAVIKNPDEGVLKLKNNPSDGPHGRIPSDIGENLPVDGPKNSKKWLIKSTKDEKATESLAMLAKSLGYKDDIWGTDTSL